MVIIVLYSNLPDDVPLVKRQIVARDCLTTDYQFVSFVSLDSLLGFLKTQDCPAIIIWRFEKGKQDPFQDIKRCLSGVTVPNKVILLTSSPYDAVKGYEYEIFRCILEDSAETDLGYAISAAVFSLNRKERTILLGCQGGFVKIMLEELLYVKHQYRKNYIFTKNNPDPVVRNGALKDLFNELNDPRLCMIDKNCFINVDHVFLLEKDQVKLMDSTVLPISRRAKPMLKEILIDRNEVFQQ